MGNTDPADPGHISLKKVEAGNLGAEFFSIWVDPQTTAPVGLRAPYHRSDRHGL